MRRSTLDELHQEWLRRPGYEAAYDALEEELAIASAMIAARAGLTQDQVAECMHTTQLATDRLESSWCKPSTRR